MDDESAVGRHRERQMGRGLTRMNADFEQRHTERRATEQQTTERRPTEQRAIEQRTTGSDGLQHRGVTGSILRIFYDIHNELGCGFLESVYAEAMTVALTEAGIPFEREPTIIVRFRGRTIGIFRPDFIVASAVIVELKGSRAIEDAHQAQLLNYLRATALEVGLLLNFGPKPTYRRLAFTNSRKIRVHPR